jgi:hypothetical protein
MTNILQRIKLLPQVVQDLIYEYNVDHRYMMYLVQREIIQKIVHVKIMKYVFIQFEQIVYQYGLRYGCTKCKNCLNWFYDSDLIDDPIHGKVLCSNSCIINYNRKFMSKYNKYLRIGFR